MPDRLGRAPGSLEIDIQPVGRRVALQRGSTLLEAVQHAGIDLPVACGGLGICGTCRVRVAEGDVSAPTAEEIEYLKAEERLQGYRLACQTVPLEAVRVEIPPESLPRALQLQVEGGESPETGARLDAWVTPLEIELPSTREGDRLTAYEHVSAALEAAGHPPLLATPASRAQLESFFADGVSAASEMRAARLAVRAAEGKLVLAGVLPVGSPLLGMAVDLGTTKVAVYLVDLETGGILAQEGFMNPQIAFGEDVVSRIAFANQDPSNRLLLQTRMVEALNASVDRLCRLCGSTVDQVVDGVVVGNTVMHHLLGGLPVKQLGAAPYVPATDQPVRIEAGSLGLNLSPGAGIYLPPVIAGYVGADHTAVLVSSIVPGRISGPGSGSPHRQVLIDIGTNTEISLVDQACLASGVVEQAVFSCSCASGPAFEGAHIRHGMRAVQGAIERVRIEAGQVEVHTIGGEAPVGMCGTGILEAVAELLTSGAIDARGVFRPGTPNQRGSGRTAEYVLVPDHASATGQDITISRQDIHEIQLAKAAIRAGIEILLAEVKLSPADIDRWTIAGAFGTYLDVKRALEIGMFPSAPIERFHQVGNAAGAGARRMLLSQGERQRAEQLVRGVHYIELTTHPGFTQAFVEAMSF